MQRLMLGQFEELLGSWLFINGKGGASFSFYLLVDIQLTLVATLLNYKYVLLAIIIV